MAYTPSLDPFLYEDANQAIDNRLQTQMRQQDLEPVTTDSTKPRFALIVGPSPFSMPRGWEFFLTSPYEGASYISTVLFNAGFPVRIIDVRYEVDPLRAAFEQVMQGTDVLGIATFEDNFPWVKELMQLVKDARPDMPIICGGSLVTSVPHVFMEHTRCDVAVISEGELTILDLMERYADGRWSDSDLSEVRGIWYRDAKGIAQTTAPRGQMMDLDSLPVMNLDLWPQSQSEMGLQPQIISSYSRGCKMDCSFCYRTTPQERAKSPEKLDRELGILKAKHGIDFIFFTDLTFTAHKRQTLEILEVIKPHDIRWTCLTRNSDFDAERANAMREANCDIALFGVESLGPKVLKTARKGSSEKSALRSMHTAWDAGIRWGGLTIVGLPQETEDTLDHMAEWAETHNHITRVKYLSLMPGTTVYAQGLSNGHIKSEVDHLNWLSIEQALHNDEFLNVTEMPESKMREAYKRIYDAYEPGPVMDFKHWPEHFEFFDANSDDAKARSTEYAGSGWRAEFASAAPPLVPGSNRFTLDLVGAPGMAERATATMECGAKQMPASTAAVPAHQDAESVAVSAPSK
jgi:anaerobic magnesium-protoporphyrin IX monomethyl ester cyclase